MFVIKLPKQKARNPLGASQERKQVMKDRRTKRAKDARKSWRREWE
jgi:hypothetical protein